MDYKKAGVDIEAGYLSVDLMKKYVKETMRPEVLADIARLTREGLTIVGPKPTASPSMQDFPQADKQVQTLASQMWSTGQWGKGRIFPAGTELQTVLDGMGIKPDCFVEPAKPFAFIHRRLPGKEIYFVSNQSDQPQNVQPQFFFMKRCGNTLIMI